MNSPQRDPFRHPGVADEIEAQLQMQEERRIEAARLARAEAEIAQLATLVRWGIFAAGALALVISLAAVAYLTDLFPRSSAHPLPRPPETPSQDSRHVPGEAEFAPSQDPLPPIASIPVHAVPAHTPPAGGVRNVITSAPAPDAPGEVAPNSQPTTFTTSTAAPTSPPPVNAIATSHLAGAASVSREYDIKAAFLAQFPNYVKWPPNAFSGANAPFTIGILGNDPFGDKLVIDGSVQGHTIAIMRSRDATKLRGAHMIFISTSERAHIPDILDSFAGANVLTVGETEGFRNQGGIIEFTRAGDSIRFRINPPAARRAGLEINAKLLRLSADVEVER